MAKLAKCEKSSRHQEQLFPSTEKVGIRYIVSIQIRENIFFALKEESKEATMLPILSLFTWIKKIFIPPRNNIFFTQLKTRNLNSLINKSKLLWGSRDKGIEAFPPEASFDRKSNRPPSWLNSFAKRIFWLWQEKKKKERASDFSIFLSLTLTDEFLPSNETGEMEEEGSGMRVSTLLSDKMKFSGNRLRISSFLPRGVRTS